MNLNGRIGGDSDLSARGYEVGINLHVTRVKFNIVGCCLVELNIG